jgi:hypothetical protein
VVKLKALADYCGTSMEMIECHYAAWMPRPSPQNWPRSGAPPRHRSESSVSPDARTEEAPYFW